MKSHSYGTRVLREVWTGVIGIKPLLVDIHFKKRKKKKKEEMLLPTMHTKTDL